MRQSWKKMLLIAAVSAPLVLMTACRSDGESSSNNDGNGPVLAQPVTIIEGVSGDNSALNKRGVFLVKNKANLVALGAEGLYPGEVNFAENDMVVLAAGEMRTGGYWVRITSISQVGDTLYVDGLANKPGEDAITTQALTYPFHAVLIKNTNATLAVAEIDGVVGQDPPMPEAE